MPAQPPKIKTMLITINGVDNKILGELAKQDVLPFFKQLLADNSIHPISSIFPASEPVDLLCGVSPAVHGFYAQQQIKSGKYHMITAHPVIQTVAPFTNYLQENGFKSLLIDVPFAELVQKTKSVTILNSHSDEGSLAELTGIQNIKSLLTHTLNTSEANTKLTTNKDTSNAVTSPALAAKIKFTKLALTQKSWDLACIDLGDSWQQRESSNDSSSSDQNSDNTQHLYQLLDRAIAEITQHLSGDDNIIIVSRTKSQEIPLQQFVEPVLCQLGLLKLNTTNESKTDAANIKFMHRLMKLISPVRSYLSALYKPGRILWEETRAFVLPGDRNSYLRINLLGREPQGIVTPGVEYDGLLRGIAAELYELKAEPCDHKAIRNISFPRRDMQGPHQDSLPDIAIEWNHDLGIQRLHSSSVSVSTEACVEIPEQNDTSGFVLISGKDIQDNQHNAGIDFRSIASTVLELFNLESPQAYQQPSLVKRVDAASRHLHKVAS